MGKGWRQHLSFTSLSIYPSSVSSPLQFLLLSCYSYFSKPVFVLWASVFALWKRTWINMRGGPRGTCENVWSAALTAWILVPLLLSPLGSPTEVCWGHFLSSQPPSLLPNSRPSWSTAGFLLMFHFLPPSTQTPPTGLWDQPALCSWVKGARLASMRAQERPEMPLAPLSRSEKL